MAGDRLIFEVVAEGKGLKVVQRQADDIASSVERADDARKKAGKGQDSYNKKEKAIHQSTLSSGRQMSKLNQTIGSGSSGLVGAYAVLAANVFAATAAFNTLRRAAQFETIVAGLDAVGAAAGRNLTAAARRIREVSDGAISAEASLRTMALGISAGFRTDQMERLTTVAKGASLALGRDMTDALDRLTRGTAKLEPEILDELGIMVRLDDATLKYATTLGKSVEDLTQFERRQAFLNATLEQGEKKFGQLAEEIDVNPYDQLSSSLADLAQEFLHMVNNLLGPFVELLVNNQRALITTLALFASTIVGSMAPALMSMITGFTRGAAATAASTKANLDNLKTTGKLPAAYMSAAGKIKEAGMSQKQYDRGLKSLNASLIRYDAELKRHALEQGKLSADYKRTALSIKEVTAAKIALTRAYNAHMIAQNKQIIANGLESLSAGSLITGTKEIGKGLAATVTQYFAAAKGGGILRGSWAVLKTVGTGLVTLLRGLIAILLGPWGIAIGIAAGAIYTFWEPIKEFFVGKGKKDISDGAQAIIDDMDYIAKTAKSFNKTIEREGGLNASAMVAGFTAVSGILDETLSNLNTLSQQSKVAQQEATKAAKAGLAQLRMELAAEEKNLADMEAAGGRRGTTGRNKTLTPTSAQAAKVARLQAAEKAAADSLRGLAAKFSEQLNEDIVATTQAQIEAFSKDPVLARFAQREIKGLQDALDEFEKAGTAGPFAMTRLRTEVERLGNPLKNITDAFGGAQDALSVWNQETNKISNKDKTPFDGAIDAAENLAAKIAQVRSGVGKDGLKLGEKAQQALIDEIRKQTGIKDILGAADVDKWVKSLKDARQVLIENAEKIKRLQTQNKKFQDALGDQAGEKGTLVILEQQEKIRKTRLDGIDKELFLKREILGADLKVKRANAEAMKDGTDKEKALKKIKEEETELEREMADLKEKRLNLVMQEVPLEERIMLSRIKGLEAEKELVNARSSVLSAEQSLFNTQKKRQQLAIEMANLQDPVKRDLGTTKISPAQQLMLVRRNRNEELALISKKEKLAIRELQIALEILEIEAAKTIMKADAILKDEKSLKAEKEAAMATISATVSLVLLQQESANIRIKAAREEAKLSREMLQVEEDRLILSSKNALIQSSSRGSTTSERIRSLGDSLRDRAVAERDQELRKQRNFARQKLDAQAKDYFVNQGITMDPKKATAEYAKVFKTTVEDMVETSAQAATGGMRKFTEGVMASLDFGDKFKLLSESMQPLIDGFRELGPEGVAIAEGMTNNMNALGGMIEVMDTFKERGLTSFGAIKDAIMNMGGSLEGFRQGMIAISGVTAAASAAASMLFATQKMAAKAAEARIDNQIKKEKEMDGKSAQSVAKIKKLEAEKEKQKRKAFEADKKMKIAQTIMATSLAVMQAFATLGPIFGGIMSAFIIAMGAKQIGIISSMQYNGGGTASKGGSPPSITVGERQNKVDVSGNNAAGELAYMRGERGQGTSASNFTPAFSGRYRATGGAAYMVGEQGPEVFVPKVPGRIVSNDDMREGGGTPINATFNINAIDASNMEETLTLQRGNIISMIREAANQTGESFLESVDTLALGDTRSTY